VTGRTFGRLEAVMPSGRGHGQTKWLCRCSCGGEKEVLLNNLVRGMTRSCGCLVKETSPKNALRGPMSLLNRRRSGRSGGDDRVGVPIPDGEQAVG
jgi:hypothetical protein